MKLSRTGGLLAASVLILAGLVTAQVYLALRHVESKQEATLQCGQWCLMRTAHVLGFPLSARKAIEVLPFDVRGQSLLDLKNSFDELGFRTTPLKAKLREVLDGPLPAILHLDEPGHYVVAVHAESDRVMIFDALGNRQRIRISSVGERFTGYALRVARDPGTAVPPGRTSRPQIQFATLYQDRGDVLQGMGTIGYEFPLINVGSESLRIHGLHSDCACMEVTGPDEIPPGGAGVVKATFRKTPNSKSSFSSHSIKVESNDTDFPVIPLMAAGNLATNVRVSPYYVDISGALRKWYLTVDYGGDDPEVFHTVQATSDVPGLSVRVISPKEYMDRTMVHFPTSGWTTSNRIQRIVEITIDPSSLPKEKTGVVKVTTSVPGFEEFLVPCSERH